MSWERYEDDFLCETYPDIEWKVREIAEKLERSTSDIYRHANELGLRRPGRSLRRINYQLVSKLSNRGWSQRRIAAHIGCTQMAVSHALTQMRIEKRQERRASA